MGELDRCRSRSSPSPAAVFKERGKKVPYKFGTMIEIPRACLIADEIATKAEFFSFGTNDLTQTILGISRDDAQKSFLTQVRRAEDHPGRPVPGARPRRRRRDDEDRASSAAARRVRGSRSGSAASTAATRRRSRSATSSASPTCRRRRTAYRSRASRRRRPRSPERGRDGLANIGVAHGHQS